MSELEYPVEFPCREQPETRTLAVETTTHTEKSGKVIPSLRFNTGLSEVVLTRRDVNELQEILQNWYLENQS